jgi:putative DNA primase/helicase
MTDDMGNIFALAEARSKRTRRAKPAPGGDPNRPMVRIELGDLPRAIDEAEAALVAIDHNLFRYGPKLVTITTDEIKVSGGDKDVALRLSHITVPALLERFDIAAQFEKFDGRSGNYVQCHCPRDVAERYLARDGNWRVPVLLGIVTAPTLRVDGSILDKPGYDEETGLFFDPMGVEFPEVHPSPTKDQARAALARLYEPIAGFGFVDAAARAVALSGILSAVSRFAVDTVPLHGFDAPVAGSGKSKLVDYAVTIATGHRAAVTNVEEVLWKQLSAALLAGSSFIALDNMVEPLAGPLLNQTLTQAAVEVRKFGTLDKATIPCCMMIFATGNNLIVAGDMTRRVLVGRLDPGVERPELREFDFDPVAVARERRAGLLVDALTVLRAWLCSTERRGMPAPLGSFERWSRLVRNALIWLGEADPVASQEEVRQADPYIRATHALIAAWAQVVGANRFVRASEVVARALEKEKETIMGDDGVEREVDTAKHRNPGLLEAVRGVTTSGSELAKSFGKWLGGNKDRRFTVDGMTYRFVQGVDSQMSTWCLQAVDVPVTDVPY